jgi:hypothetical protein
MCLILEGPRGFEPPSLDSRVLADFSFIFEFVFKLVLMLGGAHGCIFLYSDARMLTCIFPSALVRLEKFCRDNPEMHFFARRFETLNKRVRGFDIL